MPVASLLIDVSETWANAPQETLFQQSYTMYAVPSGKWNGMEMLSLSESRDT